MANRLTVLFLFFTFASCTVTKTEQQSFPRHYFNIKGFFDEQALLLKASEKKIEKTVRKDNEQEIKGSSGVDWEKEFAPFREADINKPSWADSFISDTVFFSHSGYAITYTAKEQGIPVRKVSLRFKNDSCYAVLVTKETRNILFTSRQNMVYYKDFGYKISGSLNVVLALNNRYEIKALFQ